MATLNKLFTNILLFGLAANITIFLFGAFKVDPHFTLGFTDLSQWSSWFPSTWADVMFTGAAIAGISIVAVLLRQNTYAIYALLAMAIGIILKPIGAFVLAIPTAIGSWLPPETNPFAYTNGVYNPNYVGVNPITAVITLIFTFAAFWFIFGLVVQRDVG